MKKTLTIIFTAVVVLAVACFFFNPAKERHVDAITEHYAKKFSVDSQNAVDARSYSRLVLNHALKYDDYVLFSKGSMLGEPLSFGIMGHVFVLDN